MLNKGTITEMHSARLLPMGGLVLMLLTRVGLTLLGTNIVVPAGIFMPVHLIGGLLGRFCGYFVFYCGEWVVWVGGWWAANGFDVQVAS